jgi:DNA-binding beta-propeller fold protein YncE
MIVWVFAVSPAGRLRNVSGSPFPVGTKFGSSDGIAFSPDGRYLANLDNEDNGAATVELYPVATDGAVGKQVASASCGRDARSLAFSPRGNHLAIGNYGRGGTGRIWDFRVSSEGLLRNATGSPTSSGPGGGVEALSFTRSGRRLAVLNTLGSNASIFSVGAAGGLRRIATIRASLFRPADAAFSPDGNLLAVANYGNGSVSIFSAK